MHYPRYAFSKNGKETIVAKVCLETDKYFVTFLFQYIDLKIVLNSIKNWCEHNMAKNIVSEEQQLNKA